MDGTTMESPYTTLCGMSNGNDGRRANVKIKNRMVKTRLLRNREYAKASVLHERKKFALAVSRSVFPEAVGVGRFFRISAIVYSPTFEYDSARRTDPKNVTPPNVTASSFKLNPNIGEMKR